MDDLGFLVFLISLAIIIDLSDNEADVINSKAKIIVINLIVLFEVIGLVFRRNIY